MGFFSWLDCKNSSQVVVGKYEAVYVLVPKKFRRRYGRHIAENCYDGYGRFGTYDIHEVIAMWNRDQIPSDFFPEPKVSDYDAGKYGEDMYKADMGLYATTIQFLSDFKSHVPSKVMEKRYGENWLRSIGVCISAVDEDNARLPYPIKITHDENAVYEDCESSPSDPRQGCR